MELVKGMRADADCEEEREQREAETARIDGLDEACADDDVREVPQRVGRVQHRPPIARSGPRREAWARIERRSH